MDNAGTQYSQDASIEAVLAETARAHRILDLHGHADMSMGHLSYRDPFGRGIWLKRGNLGLREVHGDDFILIDFDGQVLEGRGLRHLEWPLHTEIMRAREDVHFVAHTHAWHATLFAATTAELAPVSNPGVWFAEHGVPRFTETSHIVTTVELAAAVARTLASAEAVFMANHGVTFVGRDVKEVTLAGIFLEQACRFQLELAASGLAYVTPDHEETLEKRRRIYPSRARDNFWMYFNRELDRHEREAR